MSAEPDSSSELDQEIELLRRTGEGDRGCFEQLYERFSGVLFATAYRVLNNQEAAEDVLQDVFVQIWEKAPLYDANRGKPLTWAVTLTRNKAIDRLRSVQRRHRLQDDVEKEATTFEQFDGRSSLDAVEGIEKAQIIRVAIGKLSDEQRQAIELAFFGGLTQTEIAEKLQRAARHHQSAHPPRHDEAARSPRAATLAGPAICPWRRGWRLRGGGTRPNPSPFHVRRSRARSRCHRLAPADPRPGEVLLRG